MSYFGLNLGDNQVYNLVPFDDNNTFLDNENDTFADDDNSTQFGPEPELENLPSGLNVNQAFKILNNIAFIQQEEQELVQCDQFGENVTIPDDWQQGDFAIGVYPNGTEVNCTISPQPDSPLPINGCFDCTNIYITDQQIFVTMWVSIIGGAFFVLLFSVLHQYVKIYRTRLILAQVCMKPPPLQRTGIWRFFHWIVPTYATKDKDLLASAGLDALMFLKIQQLGMMIFLPLAIIGCVVLIPVHRNGDYLEQESAKQSLEALQGNRDVITLSNLMKYTMSNIEPGSSVFWLHLVLIIVFSSYVMWVMKRYYQEYVMLQQHYFTLGDDPNYWLIHHQMGDATNNKDKNDQSSKELAQELSEGGSRGLLQSLTRPLNWRKSATNVIRQFKTSDLRSYVRVPMGPATQLSAAASRKGELKRLNAAKDSALSGKESPTSDREAHSDPQAFPRRSFQKDRDIEMMRFSLDYTLQQGTSNAQPNKQRPALSVHVENGTEQGITDQGVLETIESQSGHTGVHEDEVVVNMGNGNRQQQTEERSRPSHRRRRTQREEDMLQYLQDAEQYGAPLERGGSYPQSQPSNDIFQMASPENSRNRAPTPVLDVPHGNTIQKVSSALVSHRLEGQSPYGSGTSPRTFPPIQQASRSSVTSPTTSPPGVVQLTRVSSEGEQRCPEPFGSQVLPQPQITVQQSLQSAFYQQTQGAPNFVRSSSSNQRKADMGRTLSRESYKQQSGTVTGDDVEVRTGSPGSEMRVTNSNKSPKHWDQFRALSLPQQSQIGLPPSVQHVTSLPQPERGLRRASQVTSYAGRTMLSNQELQRMSVPNDPRILTKQPLKAHGTMSSVQESGKELRMDSGALSETNTVLRYDAIPHKEDQTMIDSKNMIARWWALGCPDNPDLIEVKEGTAVRYDKRSALASKPSVRFRKTVNVRTADLDVIAVNAQNYAVLVTDVPRVDVMRRHTQKGILGELLDMLLIRNIKEPATKNGKVSKWSTVKKKMETGELFGNQQLVSETFEKLFPDDFVGVVPIKRHKQVDLLLLKWDQLHDRYEHADAQFQKTGVRPRHKIYGGCFGAKVDSIELYRDQLIQVEKEIERVRTEINRGPPTSSYFVLFRSQKAATIAAQTVLHPEDGHSFQTHPAPGPDEVNWQALWRHWRERDLRVLAAFPFYFILMCIPLGIFAGALTQLSSTMCSLVQEDCTAATGKPNFEDCDNPFTFYCKDNRLQNLVSAFLPSIFVATWQNLVMPHSLYYLAQVESKSFSLSALDRRIAFLFFMWDMFNIFLGGAIGGSITQSLKTAIRSPGDIFKILGESMPNSSNFFLNYVVLRAFAFVPIRLVLPHGGVWRWLLRCGGKCGCVMTSRDVAMTYAPSSVRYGYEFGIMMLIFIIGMAYAVVSPLILPFTFMYFTISWFVWRYQILYVYVRSYESGGKMWPGVFRQLMWCLYIFVFWSACVLIVKEAFYQAILSIIIVMPLLFHFQRYCSWRYEKGTMVLPLEIANSATDAYIDPLIYTPPALRPQSAGWHPEVGKAWESWGMPMYTI